MSVGATLARARENSGLSVEDVSTATRIRAGLIRQIETDDFSGCGGAVYARGHIRSIARVVGADGESLVHDYDRAHDTEPAPALVPTPALDPAEAARVDRRRPNWAAAMGVALVVICVLAAISLIGGSHGPAPNAGKEPVSQSTTPAAAPSSAPPATVPPSAQAFSDYPGAMALIRVQSSRTWLSVTTFSGRLLFQGLLSAGQHKVFRDTKGLRIVIGNAPIVDLVADGHDLGAPKSQGNVAHVTVQPRGQVQFA